MATGVHRSDIDKLMRVASRERFSVNGTMLSVSSDEPSFTAFAARLLASHVVESDTTPDVHIHLDGMNRRRDSVIGETERREWSRVDRGVWHAEEGVYSESTSFSTLCRRDALGALTVRGNYRMRPDRRLRQLWNSGVRSNELLKVYRHFVLGALFAHQEECLGYVPLHAAVVTREDRTLVLSGLSGVGKSTLALFGAGEDGWRLVADNYVLHRKTTVAGIVEGVRLSARSKELIGRDRLERVLGQATGLEVANRKVYSVSDPMLDRYSVSDVFVVKQGAKTEIREVGDVEMGVILRRIHAYLGEFTSPMGLLFPTRAASYELLRESWGGLAGGRRCWILTIGDKESLASTWGRMADALQLL